MSVVSSASRSLRLAAHSAETTSPLLSVVIVNFCQWNNTLRLTRQLAESLAITSGQAEILVVDNGSPDCPAAREAGASKICRIHRFRNNLGFARGVNEAGLRTGGEWLLLLNPDTSLSPGFLDNVSALCRTVADESPRTGVVGLGLRHADGSPQASSGPVPTFMGTLSGLLTPRQIRKCRHVAPGRKAGVDWVTGCGMLIRRDCWQALKGFDPDFFLYYEDVDFCVRARGAGWDVTHEPSVSLDHLHPLHTRRVPAPLRLMTRHALLNFASKHWSRWQSRALAGIVWVEAIARGLFARLRGEPVAGYREIRHLAADWWRDDVANAMIRVEHVADTLQEVMSHESDRD